MNGTRYPHLLSPLSLGKHTLRNRVALTATLTNYGHANRVTERWIDFLVERARGGTGLIVSEVIAVDPNAVAQAAIVTGFDDTNRDGFRRVADGVHAAGSVLVGQLWHPGRQQLWHPTRSPMGVSDQPDPYSWTVPHVMTEAEIEGVIEAYAATAARLAACGFDGVELHGAHGYLIGQFLSPWSNTRGDRFGGDLEGRTRFAREIARRVKEAAGDGFLVGIKMPGDEGVPAGIDPDEAERITRRLAATGLFDYLAYGQGNFSLSLENHVPDLYFRPGHFLDIHRRMRASAGGVPVMALGRIGVPDLAEQVVVDGSGDLVGMSRALITDAAWANKAAAGRPEDIRPCVFDNWCWGEVHAGKPLAEFHNPYLAVRGEASASIPRAGARKRITVVGGGVAGLEAAAVAAERGHAVTLLGASTDPGGRTRLEAELPGRTEIGRIVDWQRRRAEAAGAEIVLGRRADTAMVLATRPDAVVLATGSESRPLALEAEDGPVLAGCAYAALGADAPRSPAGGVLLLDQDHGPATYALADLLATRFARVHLVTPRPQIAQNVNYCSAIGVLRRLYSAGVDIRPAHRLVAIAGGVATLENAYTGQRVGISGIDLVVHVTPRRAADDLARAITITGVPVHLVGDALSPRNRMAAIHGAHLVARDL